MVISKFEESAVWDSYTASMLPKKKASKVAKAAEEPFKRVDPLQAPPGCLPSSNEWYGLKVDQTLDELLDQAHPDPIIGGPSYDKLNGLVENLKERSNVMNQIALDVHGPRQTQHAYVVASNALLDQTVKLGFALDAANHTDLANLADAVSEHITEITKEALAPLAIAGIVALVGSLVGGISYSAGHANNNPISGGLLNDINRSLAEFQDVLDDEDYAKAHASVRAFITNLQLVKSNIVELNAYTDSIDKDLVDLKSKNNKEKLAVITAIVKDLFDSGKDKKIEELVATCKDQIATVIQGIPDVDRIMEKAIKEFRGGQATWWSGLKNVWNENFVNNNVQDAVKANELLMSSCGEYLTSLEDITKHLEELRRLVSKYRIGSGATGYTTSDIPNQEEARIKKQKEYADKYL